MSLTNWSNLQPAPSSPRREQPPPAYGFETSKPPLNYAPPQSPNPQYYQGQHQQQHPGQHPGHLPGQHPGHLPGQHPGQHYPMAPAAFNANHVQVVQVVRPNLASRSTRVTCPNCRADIETKVEYESGRMTHIVAAVLCFVGCWCCVCLPYMANDFKDSIHLCPNCKQIVGRFRR